MIVGRDIHPERDIYYLGALVLEIIGSSPEKSNKLFDIFQLLNERMKVTMNVFTLTLDWLFLLGAINNNKDAIHKCF